MDRGMPRHKINVDEYYRMAEEGLLAPDARVELIEGEIIDMVPIGTAHAARVTYLDRMLQEALGRRANIRVQNSLRLSSYSEVQPDIVIALERDDDYEYKHPYAADTLLVVEVSDSSLAEDKRVKVPLYAKHGVPEVWIVDVQRGRLEIYRDVKSGRYESVLAVEQATPLTIQLFPEIPLNLPKLFERC
jgi:Uma2 family endonuclease